MSNPFDNQFDNWLYHVYCQLSNRLYNPVWQPVERTVAVRSTRLLNRLYNQFNNRLYRVNYHDAMKVQEKWNFIRSNVSNRTCAKWFQLAVVITQCQMSAAHIGRCVKMTGSSETWVTWQTVCQVKRHQLSTSQNTSAGSLDFRHDMQWFFWLSK